MDIEIININLRNNNIILDNDGRGVFLPDDVVLDEKDNADTVSRHDREWIRCRNCNSKIARVSDRIDIDGVSVHILRNPAGIIFRVVCFSDADGVVNLTQYSEEYSWFSGFLWSVSLCRICGNHIGWHYTSGSRGFYGLIADRLAGL